MPLAPSRLVQVLLLLSAAALPAFGCNMLLDNTPATSRTDQGEPGGSTAEPSAEDASTRARDDAVGCAEGTKACGGVCVRTDDPAYGCGAGACTPCALAHARATCADGACAIAACEAGWGDCDGRADDGCEGDLAAATSCGRCGAACVAPPNAETTCDGASCTMQCLPGFDDCNDDPDDGCEADLQSDAHNCGKCKHRCHLGICKEGACVVDL